MNQPPKEPLTHAGLIAQKLAVEAEANVIGDQAQEDGASLKTVIALLCYEIAASHVIQQRAAVKAREFDDFARPEPVEAGIHAVGWRCAQETARIGNLALRAQDRTVRGALALQRLHALIGKGNGGGSWTWIRPDWLDAFPELTPDNLAKANAAQRAADERRRREAEEQGDDPLPKLHAAPGQRRGRLKNGNPAGDYLAAPRCGAHSRAGAACRQPAMKNGRCRFHGGKSTGPRTAEGLHRAQTARLVHGCRSAEIIDFRSAAARSTRRLAQLTKLANELARPAGHGVHRSVSPAPLDEAEVNRKDAEAPSERVARILPLRQEKDVIARPQAALKSFKASLLASTAAFTSPLRVFAPLRFNPSQPAAAGHGLDRSFAPAPLDAPAPRRRAA